jgi:hypothetical protein
MNFDDRNANGRGARQSGGPRTPGMAMVQDAVQFTNAQVLDPTRDLSGTVLPTGMPLGADALVEQSAAMMVQDMRGFLQSIEMILVPATARALAETLEENPAGVITMAMIDSLMTTLGTFAGTIVTEAGAAKGAFQ